MNISEERYGTVEVVSPDGPIIAEECADFTSVMERQLAGANPRVVLCLKDVPYMDSGGLEALLMAARRMREQSLPLKLSDVTATCREILDLTELLGEFELFEDVEDAVRSFCNS